MKRYSSNSYNTSSGGMSIMSVLQLIFIVIKLIGAVDWSCGTVFIPTWISLGLVALVVLISLVINKDN